MYSAMFCHHRLLTAICHWFVHLAVSMENVFNNIDFGMWKLLIPFKKKLHGLSPRANYTDRAIAVCLRSGCQPLRIDGATWSA
jgi:hypothetical protein